MAKFAVFEVAQEKIIAASGKTKDQLVGSQLTTVNLLGGLIAGMAAAVVSVVESSRSASDVRAGADVIDLLLRFRSRNPPTPSFPKSTKPRVSPVREPPPGLSPWPSSLDLPVCSP